MTSKCFKRILLLICIYLETKTAVGSGAAPTFDNNPYLATSLNEELPAGTTLTITPGITASDGEGDTLYFSLTGADAGEFVINGPNTDQPVVIRTARKFDFEAGDTSFTFSVDVFDGTTTVSLAASITLTINDLNDNSPTCSPTYYYGALPENANVGDAVATITGCSDADAGTTLSYSESEAQFQFPVATSGAMTLQAALDYETATSHTITVTVSDGTNTGTAYVIVTVTPVNEATPAWAATYGPYNLDEHKTVGTTIATISATDADDDVDGEILYSITSVIASDASSGLSKFIVNPVSGILQVAGDVERDPPSGVAWYDIVVKAEDQGGTPNSVTQTIRVDLVDINDQTPVFGSLAYTGTVSEGDPPATAIVTLVATDADPDLTFTATYSITGGDPGSLFQLGGGGNEVQIQTAIDLDSGDPDSYTLVVEVTDGGTPQLTGTATVYVSVTSSNDADPVFGTTTPSGAITISENAPVGYSVATVTATDTDCGPDGDISYSISGGDDDDNFVIDTASGLIELKKQLDFETATNNPISLEVKASDDGATVRTATIVLTINIGDENDNDPSCTQYSYIESKLESVAVGTTFVGLTCTDADVTDTITYSIIGGNTNNDFAVSAAGVVTNANALDYDSATKSYVLVVRPTDGTNSVDVTIAVEVLPVNENTPSFATNPNLPFSETTAVGTTITTYTAIDSDHDPHDIESYSMTGGGMVFTIDATTGEIKLAEALDYDTAPTSYTLSVTATDGGGLTGSGTVTVVVQDANDNSPICVPMTHTITHNENSATIPDTLIANMACNDADGSAGFGTASLTYAITQTPAGSDFSVTAGVLTAITALDYETTQSYSIDVAVTDGGGLSAVVPITVTVGAVNEGPPVFSGTFSQNILESTAIGTSVDDVTATDPDDSSHPDGELEYSLTAGNTNNKFTIDSSTGRVTVNGNLDRETTTSYLLQVTATETGGINSASTTLTVFIDDVDDSDPDCTVKVFSLTVNEDETAGLNVQTLGCTDADSSSTLTYTITTGDTSKFGMTGDSLQLVAGLDFDVGPRQYNLEITVSDGTNSIVVPGSVTVDPINEAFPIFTATTYPQNVNENTVVGTVVETVVANDADSADSAHGQVIYSVVSGADPMFTLDSTSGDVTLSGTLDRETTASYTMVIEATDSTNSATATVTITVTDDNDNAPVFSPRTYSTSLAESTAAVAPVLTVAATDTDDPGTNNNGVIAYSISAGNTGTAFAIDATTGAITMVGTLDLETTSSYTLTILAEDLNGGAGALTGQATVLITITGVNEADPVYSSVLYSATVAETLGVGSSVTTIIAMDADDGLDGDVYHTMPVHPNFYLDSDSGLITLKSALDFDSTTNYGLTVTAWDRGTPARSSTSSVTVTVTDINDIIPDCTPRSYISSLREDDPVTTAVTYLTCSDPEPSPNGDLLYTIVTVNGAAGSGPFTISAAGAVTLNAALDHETTASYSIEIEVSDSGTVPSALSTTVVISVNVEDVNEATPVFTAQPAAKNVPENTAVGTSINTITATDADTADSLTYSFSASSSKFDIDANTGEITLKAALDRETTSSYVLNVVATDDGTVDAIRSATHVFTIMVTDSNDGPPVFNPASYVTSISESSAVGLTATTVTATDSDSGSNGAFTFSIQSGNTGSVFRVDQVSTIYGEIVVDDISFLDYETLTVYNLEVIAIDGGGTTSTTTVAVNIQPYNEAAPVFTPGPTYSSTWPENTALGTVLDTVAATDTDAGPDGDVSYYIQGPVGITNTFGINTATGDVSLVGPLDRETAGTHTITIIGVDLGANPGQLTGTATVSVAVTDVNDVTPVCSPTAYTASLPENTAATTTAATVTCTDGDSTAANNVITYSISSGNGAGNFVINPASGLVQTVAAPTFDYETTASYTLGIEATDSGTSALTGTATIEVQITGINEHDPVFASDPYTCNINEDAAVNDDVQLVAATDADSPLTGDGTFVYSIFSGNTGNKFGIDAGTGQINVITQLDFEPPNPGSYDLVIYATDSGINPSARTGSTTVSITINDVNDNIPSCTDSIYATTLDENSPAAIAVYSPTCTDADSGANGVLIYSITSGNTGSAFTINSGTGAITVATPAALDAETTPSFSLVVTVTDTGVPALSTTISVSVTLDNLNEATPAFSPSSAYSVSISESSAIGTSVISVLATDADTGVNGQIEYTITGGNTGNGFHLDPDTGDLFVQATLDRETTASYTLAIQAADKPTNPADILSAVGTITVTITDENDETPTCPSTPYTSSNNEDETLGTIIAAVTCTDGDTGANGVLTYSINAGNAESKFTISSVTGTVSLAAAFDYETTTSYSLTVTAVDGGATASTGSALVLVNVGPINEASPAITVPGGGYVPTVSEAAALGTVVETVVGTDADAGVHGDIRWSITAGNTQNKFSIDEQTGVITVVSPLNRENTASYTLTIQAMDSIPANGDELTDTEPVIITVTDENDNFPLFVPASYGVSVMEGATLGSTLVTLTIQDDDDGVNAQYDLSITAGNVGTAFSISGDELVLAAALDYETTSQYQLTISVTDRGVPALSSDAYVIVNVVSENEHPPVFSVSTVTVSFAENIAVGASIYDADATDLDLGDGGDLHYSIVDGNPGDVTFLIDQDTGVITTGSYLDYDTAPNSYVLNISVTDNGGVIGPSILYDFMQLTVILTDVNDLTPTFTMNTYTTSINENIGNSQAVVTVTANDGDSGLNGAVLYSIQSGDGAGQFVIDTNSGLISTDATQTLDYDTKSNFALMIKAVDQGTPVRSSYCLVTIALVDINNSPPVFNPVDFYVTVQEGQAPSAFTANVHATDDDVGLNGQLDFSITLASDPLGHFSLTQTSNNDGLIETAFVLDREITSQYTLIVEASDNGVPKLTGTATVTVYVTDINDNAPVMQSVPYDVSVSEDVPSGHTVMHITATDADEGKSQSLQYSILSGDLGQFTILPDYGIIKTTTALDREVTNIYYMVVQVVDQGTPPLTATTTTTLTITDVNDNNPVFTAWGWYYVQENVNNFTYVGQVVATDSDIGINAVLQYSIVDTVTGIPDHFYIEPDTGIIRSWGASLDRETLDRYVLLVRVRDDGTPPLYTDKQVEIRISDHNDVRPFCSHGRLTLDVMENLSPGIFLADLNATDHDSGYNGLVHYSIDPSDHAFDAFSIDQLDGVLSLKRTIDREVDSTFDFHVHVTDNAGSNSLSGTCHVVVNVMDENDNSPRFEQPYYSFEMAFNAAEGFVISQLVAVDNDAGLNGNVYYNLYEDNDEFAVDYTSGNLTKARSGELPPSIKHLFSVVATDAGPGTTRSDSVQVRVDTFPPNSVVISFDMSLTREMFTVKEDDFASKLAGTLYSRYPDSRVTLWKVIDDLTRTTVPSNRRRLLQEDGIIQPYVTAAVYAVANDITYTAAGADEAKEFIKASELLAIWQGDPETSAPSSAITGEDFDEYSITKVRQYYDEEDDPWYKQTIWIIVLACSIGGFLLLLLIIILIIVFCCCRKRKTNSRVDERAQSTEERQNKKNGQPPPSVLLMPVPEKKHGPTNNIFVTNPWDSPKIEKKSSNLSQKNNSMEKGRMPPPDPSKNYYDGRAVDPVTGKTYEYNSLTGERRWVTATKHK